MMRYLRFVYARIIPWLVFIHASLFIVFWQTNRLFYTSTNDYLASMVGKRLDYVSLLTWVSVFVAVWSFIRGISDLAGKSHKLAILTSWIYGILSLIYVIFFYGSFWLLFSESPVQLVRLEQIIAYYRLALDIVMLLGFAFLVGLLVRRFLPKRQGKPINWAGWVGMIIVYLLLCSLPAIYPPASITRSPIPDKPLLVAHRGASMLAPENTLVSGSLAAEIGAYGLETDIQASRDGGLFLLHDDSFDRTTSIKSVFPGREAEPASNFTLAEIAQLNAGEWFVEQDPFHAIRDGLVTPEEVQVYLQQSVPVLADWLDIVGENHLIFIFDLKQPPADHPYASTFFSLAFNQIHDAEIDPQVWFLVDQEQLQTIRDQAPDMKPAFGANYQDLPAAADLVEQGYQIVNVEYGISAHWIHDYQAHNLWVNVYTVDEPWQFSRLWLLGVNSVTTSNVLIMDDLDHPVFSLPYTQYLVLWSFVGLVGLGFIIGMATRIVKPASK